MNAIDTNVLVRFVTNDDPVQSAKVRDFFKKTEAASDKLFVPLVVVVEMIWVLESAYGLDRQDIVKAIAELLGLSVLKFEHDNLLLELTRMKSGIGLPDLVIGLVAKASGCQATYSFDRKACKSGLFRELG